MNSETYLNGDILDLGRITNGCHVKSASFISKLNGQIGGLVSWTGLLFHNWFDWIF